MRLIISQREITSNAEWFKRFPPAGVKRRYTFEAESWLLFNSRINNAYVRALQCLGGIMVVKDTSAYFTIGKAH